MLHVALLLLTLPGLAKECPSRLLPNLHPISASPWSWGAELKSTMVDLNGTGYWYYGLAAALAYETDAVSLFAQGEFKEKRYSECQYPEEVSPLKLKRLSLDWRFNRFTLSVGRQEVTAGLGLSLDDFFDGFRLAYANRRWRAEGGVLVLARSVARESFSCQQCFFFEYTSSWKNLMHSSWGDDVALYADLTWKSRSQTLGLLYIKSIARDSLFDFQQLAAHASLALPLGLKARIEASAQRFDQDGRYAYGHLVELSRRIDLTGLGHLDLALRHIYGSSANNMLFTPLYGNAALGERMHYSVRQGSTWGGVLKFQPAPIKRLQMELQYYQNSLGWLGASSSREWDAGISFAFDRSKHYQAFIQYTQTNSLDAVNQQIAAQLRIAL